METKQRTDGANNEMKTAQKIFIVECMGASDWETVSYHHTETDAILQHDPPMVMAKRGERVAGVVERDNGFSRVRSFVIDGAQTVFLLESGEAYCGLTVRGVYADVESALKAAMDYRDASPGGGFGGDWEQLPDGFNRLPASYPRPQRGVGDENDGLTIVAQWAADCDIVRVTARTVR